MKVVSFSLYGDNPIYTIGCLNNVSLWKKYFPAGPDWRDTSDEYALPGYLAAIMTTSNDIRNRQLVTIVKELTQKGERVFLICGSSHAYCVSPAFRQ